MCWKQRKNLQLRRIIFFSLYIWYLNECFPSHTGELFLILRFSVCFPHQNWNLTIASGEEQISISLTVITRAIRALLWTATAQHWPNSSTASYAFSLACSALFFDLILHFSHALFCSVSLPSQFASLLYLSSILLFPPESNIQPATSLLFSPTV